MAAAPRPWFFYRLCLYEDASQSTSFRRGHVTRASHPLILAYTTPLLHPTHDFYVQGVAGKRKRIIFKASRKEKGALLYTATKIKESLSPPLPESAEGFFRHTAFPVLGWEAGREVFLPKEGFCCEVRGRLVVARDAGGERASS